MNNQFSVSTLWDSRAMKPNRQSRVMLSISINRERFLVSLKVYSTKVDYDKAMSGRSLSELQKVLRTDINSFIDKAESLLERLTEPTKETFIRFFKSDTNLSNGAKVDVYSLYKIKFDLFNKEERFGSAHSVRCSWYSLRTFKKELFLEDIDEGFLKSYQTWMLKKGSSITTVGIYLRNLRTIYNAAVNDGLISGANRPFKNLNLSSNVKSKAVLYPEHLKALWNYRTESKLDQRAIAYFFFCYLGNGMNFRDLPHLRFKNVQGDVLTFIRQKTKRTKANHSEIKVHLQDAMKKIIDVWGNSSKQADDFIFPMMAKYKNEKHFNDTINRFKKISNKRLSRIGAELGFTVHLCLNLARHSFATKLKIDGTDTSLIKDAMGHSSLAVTEHYLKSLPNSHLAQLNSKLMDFQ